MHAVPEQPSSVRLDVWLVRARFFKTRRLASGVCAGGKVRVDGILVRKPHYQVRVGQVLTFPAGRRIHVVRVAQLGTRRGPAAEARTLYEEITES